MSNKTQNILFTAISLITGLGTIATGLVVTYAGGLGLRGLIKKTTHLSIFRKQKSKHRLIQQLKTINYI